MASHFDGALWLTAHEDHEVRVFASLGAHALIRNDQRRSCFLRDMSRLSGCDRLGIRKPWNIAVVRGVRLYEFENALPLATRTSDARKLADDRGGGGLAPGDLGDSACNCRVKGWTGCISQLKTCGIAELADMYPSYQSAREPWPRWEYACAFGLSSGQVARQPLGSWVQSLICSMQCISRELFEAAA
jgi:hypothetical protein